VFPWHDGSRIRILGDDIRMTKPDMSGRR